MLSKWLYKITGKMPCRLIYIGDGPYLERYYVGKIFGVTLYLHRFVSADSERALHDHPWDKSFSIVLAGSYMETRLDYFDPLSDTGVVTKERKVKWFNLIRGDCFHLIGKAEKETWTLFMHGKNTKGWGFLECQQNKHWEYLTDAVYTQQYDINASKGWVKTAHIGNNSTREKYNEK